MVANRAAHCQHTHHAHPIPKQNLPSLTLNASLMVMVLYIYYIVGGDIGVVVAFV